MNLAGHYNNLWQESLNKFQKGHFSLDPLLGTSADQRFGITLLARPDNSVKQEITLFLKEMAALEPQQYYYPESDIHITVMSIISCYEGFSLETINTADYISLIKKILEGINSFKIDFRGITASPATIMIQGFPGDSSLDEIRNKLRHEFGRSGLQQSLDQRYIIQTAHATVIRFRTPLCHQAEFIGKLQKYRDYPFGTTEITQLELVFNDWYQRQALVKPLYNFALPG